MNNSNPGDRSLIVYLVMVVGIVSASLGALTGLIYEREQIEQQATHNHQQLEEIKEKAKALHQMTEKDRQLEIDVLKAKHQLSVREFEVEIERLKLQCNLYSSIIDDYAMERAKLELPEIQDSRRTKIYKQQQIEFEEDAKQRLGK